MFVRFLLALVVSVLTPAAAFADELALNVNDTEFPVTRFEAQPGGDRLLWIPSEYGLQPKATYALAKQASRRGLSVWVADLHSAYFIAPGRRSLFEVPVTDIAELIAAAIPDDGRLFLLSAGRGAALTLMALHQLQETDRLDQHFSGVILLHPNLLARTPRAGEDAVYLPIAYATNLPIYLIQPLNSSKRWYIKDLLQALRQGGSDVFTHPIRGAGDGYHVRSDVSPEEIALRKRLPDILVRASQALTPYNKLRTVPPVTTVSDWSATAHAGMQPWRNDPNAPPLRLQDINGHGYDLSDERGKVTLINFWATWCPPCVEELPALQRLRSRMQGKDFRLLTVDVGETAEDVVNFMRKQKVDLPVLMDSDGAAFQAWRLRAFPSTFILDRKGHIRYGHFGALAWDSQEIVRLIEDLLAEDG